MYKRYKVVIAQGGKTDVKNKKRYILQNFKYREYAEKFSARIKKAAEELAVFPNFAGRYGLGIHNSTLDSNKFIIRKRLCVRNHAESFAILAGFFCNRFTGWEKNRCLLLN